ncbi:MAG: ABC transporter permease [Firmicutes bacterium]|nr:ABC transporter permease [Bacillota bacterium]
MAAYVLRRFLSLLGSVLLITAVTFLVLRALPGNPAELMLGMDAPPGALQALSRHLGLDLPLPVQYLSWLAGAVHGDFGRSLLFQLPVGTLIAQRLPITLALALLALLLGLAAGIPLGVWAASRRSPLPSAVTAVFAQAGLAVPSFWLGTMLALVFALDLRLLPPDGVAPFRTPLALLAHLLLPAVTLAVPQAASTLRLVRASVLETLERDFVRTAQAKGLGQGAVLYRHALPNAMAPVATLIGMHLGALIAGTIIVENVFSIPGLGSLVVQAVAARDVPLVEACVAVFATCVVAVNFLVDLTYRLWDPKVVEA